MRKLVRVKIEPQDSSEIYNYKIMLEAVVEGDRLAENFWLGTVLRSEGEYTFRLERDGRMDFGWGYEDKDRYWITKLPQRNIRVGEVFSIVGTDETDKDRECMYAITEVQTLMREAPST